MPRQSNIRRQINTLYGTRRNMNCCGLEVRITLYFRVTRLPEISQERTIQRAGRTSRVIGMSNGDAGDQYARYSLSRRVVGFAEDVIADGKSRGRRMKIGRVDSFMGKHKYRQRGFDRTAPLYLTDDTIIKYINHPKGKTGATVPTKLLPAFVRALNNPKHIYQDVSGKNLKKGNLIYVGTLRHPDYKGKVIKAVVHAGYTQRGEVFHKVKSFGIVKREDMKGRQYVKIK